MTSSRPRRSLAGIQPRCRLLQREWSASDFQSDSQKRACKAVAHLLPCNEIPFAWLAATDASSDMHCHLAMSRAFTAIIAACRYAGGQSGAGEQTS